MGQDLFTTIFFIGIVPVFAILNSNQIKNLLRLWCGSVYFSEAVLLTLKYLVDKACTYRHIFILMHTHV